MQTIKTQLPDWFEPLMHPVRYKGLKGGRGSGKSHAFAEWLIIRMIQDADLKAVCIREVQKSLKFSAKQLIEDKIEKLKVSHLFEVTQIEIRRKGGNGIIIFQGLQDHTADSIKSLEGFNIAWVEEGQSISERSLKLLRPTIREENSELWFSWNPENETDPVDDFFIKKQPENSICIHVNSENNPLLPETLRLEREQDRKILSDEDYDHIWNGAYNKKSDAIVFKDKFEVDYFEPLADWTRLQGLDWGFSQDPTAGTVIFVDDENLYIRYEFGKVGLELDDTPSSFIRNIPDFEKHLTRADNARPESISYCQRHGLPNLKGEPKLKIEDGIQFMKSFKRIIIHPDCKETAKEFRLYSYKVDKRSGDVLTEIQDKHNHYLDSIRYALYPIIKNRNVDLFLY